MDDIRTARAVRMLGAVIAASWVVLGVAWLEGRTWATGIWPWPEVPMTFVFLASIAASIAVIWTLVAWTGEVAALSGVGLNIAVAGAGTGLHLLSLYLVAPAIASLVGAALGLLLFAWARRQPVRDRRAMPPWVRAAFVAFTVTLVVAGGALSVRQQVFPWRLHPSSAVMIGAIFLGAAAYFGHAVLQRSWAHAAAPLWGFLAYDLVLFGPYLRMLTSAETAVDDYYGGAGAGSVNLTSLSIYLAVLALSAAIAMYCLLFHPPTRLFRPRAAGQPS